MPYAPHNRLTLSGVLFDEAPEAWSFSLSLDQNQFNGLDLNQAQFDDIVADCGAFISRPGTLIRTQAYLKQVKFAWIGADGKYTREPMMANVNVQGGSPFGPLHPAQVSLAISLNTDLRGKRGRGRFYLPLPAVAVEPTTGLISVADRDSVEASAAQFLNDLNNEPGVDVLGLSVAVASSFGALSHVRSVRVGRALDTIRSRRRSLVEAHGVPTLLAGND